MSAEMNTRSYPDGTVLFDAGDRADCMYIIRSGKVRIYREKDGHETTLDILKPGDFFGEMSLFDKRPRSAAAQVVGDTELQLMTLEDLESQITDPFVWGMMVKLAERIRTLDNAFERLEVQNVVRQEHLANLPIRRSWGV